MDETDPPGDRRLLPVACTLGPADAVDRLRRWQRLGERAAPRTELRRGLLEVSYRPEPGVLDELRALSAAEQTCCAFVTWSVAEVAERPTLRVTAPAERPDAVLAIAALFGVADRVQPSSLR